MSLKPDDDWYVPPCNRKPTAPPTKAEQEAATERRALHGSKPARITNLGFGAAGDGRAL